MTNCLNGTHGTHGTPELDADAAKLEAMSADAGATLEDLGLAPSTYCRRAAGDDA